MEVCRTSVILLMVFLSVVLSSSAQRLQNYQYPTYGQRYYSTYYRYPYHYGYRYPTGHYTYSTQNTPNPSDKRYDTGQVILTDVTTSPTIKPSTERNINPEKKSTTSIANYSTANPLTSASTSASPETAESATIIPITRSVIESTTVETTLTTVTTGSPTKTTTIGKLPTKSSIITDFTSTSPGTTESTTITARTTEITTASPRTTELTTTSPRTTELTTTSPRTTELTTTSPRTTELTTASPRTTELTTTSPKITESTTSGPKTTGSTFISSSTATSSTSANTPESPTANLTIVNNVNVITNSTDALHTGTVSSSVSSDKISNLTNGQDDISKLTITSFDGETNETLSTPVFQPFTMKPVYLILEHPEETDVKEAGESKELLKEHRGEELGKDKNERLPHPANIEYSISKPIKVCCDDEPPNSASTSNIQVTSERNKDISTTEMPGLQKFFFSNLFGAGGFLGESRPQHQPINHRPSLQRPHQQPNIQYRQQVQHYPTNQKLSEKSSNIRPVNIQPQAFQRPQDTRSTQQYTQNIQNQHQQHYPPQNLPQRPPIPFGQIPIRVPQPVIRTPSGQLLQQVVGPVPGPAPGATWLPSSNINQTPPPAHTHPKLTWVPSDTPARQDSSETLLFVDKSKIEDKIQTVENRNGVQESHPSTVLESESKDTILILGEDQVKHFLPETVVPSQESNTSSISNTSQSPPKSNSPSSSETEGNASNSGHFQSKDEIITPPTLVETSVTIEAAGQGIQHISSTPPESPAVQITDVELPGVVLEEKTQNDTQQSHFSIIHASNSSVSQENPSISLVTGDAPQTVNNHLKPVPAAPSILQQPPRNSPPQPVRVIRLPFRPTFQPHEGAQPIRVPIRPFRQSGRKPIRQRPPPAGFIHSQKPPQPSHQPLNPVQPLQTVTSVNPRPPPLPTESQAPKPFANQRPQLSTPPPQTSPPPQASLFKNKSDQPLQGILPQFNPSSGLQFTLIKPPQIPDKNDNTQDILPQFNPASGLTFSLENEPASNEGELEDIVPILKPDPFSIIAGPSLSNQTASDSQQPEEKSPPSIPEQVVLPAITVVSSVNFNRQPPTTSKEDKKSDLRPITISEELTTQTTLPAMNIFDIVPITKSPTEASTLTEISPLPSTSPKAETLPNISETVFSPTTEKMLIIEGNSSTTETAVIQNSTKTNILAGGFQLASDDETGVSETAFTQSAKQEILSLAGPGPMKPIPIDSAIQPVIDEEKTLKPGSVPIKPIQITEVDNLEDDLADVVQIVALLHRAVPSLNQDSTKDSIKGTETEKEMDDILPVQHTPQIPVQIRPIPSGAFIPGIGLAQRPEGVPIRLNKLPPNAILIRRPGPPPSKLPASNGQFRPGVVFTIDEAGKPHFPPQLPRPQQPQPDNTERKEISSSVNQPGSSSFNRPVDEEIQSNSDTRPQENLEPESLEETENGEPFISIQNQQRPSLPQIPETLTPIKSSSLPTPQRPERPPPPSRPLLLPPPPPPPPSIQRPQPQAPNQQTSLLPESPSAETPENVPVLQKPPPTQLPPRPLSQPSFTPALQRPQNVPPHPIQQRPESLIPRPISQRPENPQPRPVPQRPENLPPRPFPQRPENQPSRPVPQRPENLPPRPIPQRPENIPHQTPKRPVNPVLQRPESQLPLQLVPQRLPQRPKPQRPENLPQRPTSSRPDSLPRPILQNPTSLPAPQRPPALPPFSRPPTGRPQTLQNPEVPNPGMIPPPRPFLIGQPRPPTRPGVHLTSQFQPRPPAPGPFFRPGIPPLGVPISPASAQPQPTIPLSTHEQPILDALQPNQSEDNIQPIQSQSGTSFKTEAEETSSNQSIRGEDQELINDILSSLPDFLKGSVKVDQTNLHTQNAVAISNSYGNVIYQKRGITYIDQED